MSESAEEKHELAERIDGAPSSDLKEDANGSLEAGKRYCFFFCFHF